MLKVNLQDLEKIKNRKPFDSYVGKNVVYKITNTINGKVYIGVTKRIKRRIAEHIKTARDLKKLVCYIHKAVKKYGTQNFTFEILEVTPDRESVMLLEKKYILQYKSNVKENGYNLTSGGEDGSSNADVTIKRRANAKNKVKIAKYNTKGELIKAYDSIKDASRDNDAPDNDLHRSHKKLILCKGFMYRKFYTKEPPKTIEPYINRRGLNFKIKGRLPVNAIPVKLICKNTNEVLFSANSLTELSSKANINLEAIRKSYYNNNPKKLWKVIKQ